MIDFNKAAPGDKAVLMDGAILTVFNAVRPDNLGQAFNGLQFRANGITWAYTSDGVCENDSEMDIMNYVHIADFRQSPKSYTNFKIRQAFLKDNNLSNNMYFCSDDNMSQDVIRLEVLVKDGEVFTRETVRNISQGMHGCLWARAWNTSVMTLLDISAMVERRDEDKFPLTIKYRKRTLHIMPFSNRLGPRKLRGQHESER